MEEEEGKGKGIEGRMEERGQPPNIWVENRPGQQVCAERRTSARESVDIDRYLAPAPELSSKPAAGCCCYRSTEQTDGRTDTRPSYEHLAHTLQATSIIRQTGSDRLSQLFNLFIYLI